MKNEFNELYELMASSNDVANMRTFGDAHKEMMEWFIANHPDLAEKWIEKLSAVKWINYLTPQEAERIVKGMEPAAPWNREQWRQAMEGKGYDLSDEPYYNPCALWTVMDMIMSDSGETISRYVAADKVFDFVYELAVDKLTDEDEVFSVRKYFSV